MRLFSFFNNKEKHTEATEIGKLFSFLAGITHNPDAIENYLYRYNKIKKFVSKKDDRQYITLYLDWEEFITNNRPSNNRIYTQESLRQAVRNEIRVKELGKKFRILFLPKREQLVALYSYFTNQLADYIIKNLGTENLEKNLQNLSVDPLLAKLCPPEKGFDFDLLESTVTPNTIDHPLNEITNSFKHLVSNFYNTIELSLGEKVSRTLFNNLISNLKEDYNADIVATVLKIVPEKVLDFDDWLSLMSKKELERQVREKTSELETATTSLESEVTKRTEELQVAYRELKILDEKKSEFISVAAHQLRTPLSGLKWSLSMLKDGELGPVNKEQREFLQKSLITNDKVTSIINDLLEIDLLLKDKVVYKIEPTDILPIINTVISDLEPQAKQKGIRFVKPDLPKDVKMIAEIDGTKISIVLQNLIDNAIKYSDRDDTITITVTKVNTVITITIKDTGIGIPKKAQKNGLFKRFFRADNAVRKVTESSGIGLFISKNIIEDHGGRLWFESAEGKGSTFSINLPMYRNNNNQGLSNMLDKRNKN